MASTLIKYFNKTGAAEVQGSSVFVEMDSVSRKLQVYMIHRLQHGTMATGNGGDLLLRVEEGEKPSPFISFGQPFLEDFPGGLEALYLALHDFFENKAIRAHPSEQHLADMRAIVAKKLGVSFDG